MHLRKLQTLFQLYKLFFGIQRIKIRSVHTKGIDQTPTWLRLTNHISVQSKDHIGFQSQITVVQASLSDEYQWPDLLRRVARCECLLVN